LLAVSVRKVDDYFIETLKHGDGKQALNLHSELVVDEISACKIFQIAQDGAEHIP